ncbi:hypothetical protein BT93_A0709 [Corymbia citriodora subsp. variegata]|nr:hypothetical protein BT93_A0709 [Corymbia citriodora subsp. variegata]
MTVIGRKLRWLAEKLRSGEKLARRGCFVVYVGEEWERREIPVKYLNSMTLQVLFNQCLDESGENTGLHLCCSLGLLNWVLALAMAKVEETDCSLPIKNDGIIHKDTHPIQSFSNFIVVV